jgi:glycosyltransferase involved in cell wall biosynthesis
MRVSIITISFNSASTIEDTINSVLAQDYSNIEYIVIDGCSTDGTVNIINKFHSKIHYFLSEKDQGIYDAMNKGLRSATGDIIGILNSDDIYENDQVISKIVETFSNTNSDAVYGDLVYVKKDDTKSITRKWISGEYKEGMFLKGWMPPHPTFFVKKEVYQKFGLFNISFKISADYEIMLRFIHKNKISISYLPQVLVKMRAGGESNITITNRLHANKEDRLAWRINGLNPAFFTLWLKPFRKISQFLKR